MNRAPLWFERKFDFTFPVELFPNLCARLRGTPARLGELVGGASRDALTRKAGEEWSAQEHAGHLANLEPLWAARVEDFLTEGSELTRADLTNRKTHDANHNGRPVEAIVAEFREARSRLLARIETMDPSQISRTKLHPRLQQPMRLVDHLFFAAEHDDHHLVQIWERVHGT